MTLAEQSARFDLVRAIERAIDTHGEAARGVVLKALGEALPTPATVCRRCCGPHLFDTSIENPTWNRVIRAKGTPELLCLSCIVAEFAKAGEGFTATLWGDEVDGVPIAVRFGR